ncbi:MAG: hypothetical protein IKJ63_04560 [Clostridia bacterium]|nr:hypothetical protein [Clostridia bacterium]MBR2414634.1 hypothetical protein [Clostridia bacterium]MBR3954723.1 hypothetical protein [Clostridia bacterium]
MNLPRIIFCIAYLIVLVCYFFSETSGNHKRRVVNKCIMATMFLGYFLFESHRNGYWSQPLFFLCMAAFIFSWLGDVLLLFSFLYGGISFMVGNAFFVAHLVAVAAQNNVTFAQVWWAIPLTIVVASVFYILHFTKKVDFKTTGILMPIYVTTVTSHGMLSMAVANAVGGIHMILLSAGLVLFMISDYFLTTHKFIRHEKWVLRCNSGTYFTGMLLAAVSFTFI